MALLDAAADAFRYPVAVSFHPETTMEWRTDVEP